MRIKNYLIIKKFVISMSVSLVILFSYLYFFELKRGIEIVYFERDSSSISIDVNVHLSEKGVNRSQIIELYQLNKFDHLEHFNVSNEQLHLAKEYYRILNEKKDISQLKIKYPNSVKILSKDSKNNFRRIVTQDSHLDTYLSNKSEDKFSDIFDPNLVSIREKIIKVIRSSDFNADFHNPYAVYTALQDEDMLSSPVITKEMLGKVNAYIWWEFCSLYVEALRGLAGFPYNPPTKLYADRLYISRGIQAYGQRIFGYIIPPRTGLYRFAISSDDCSELWLSYDHDPRHSEKIAYLGFYGQSVTKLWAAPGEYTKDQNQQSLLTRLLQGKPYYFEILHVNSAGDDHVQVSWLIPGNIDYEVIIGSFLASFILDPEDKIVPETYHPLFVLPIHNEHLVTTEHAHDDRDAFLKFHILPYNFTEKIFEPCEYAPSFALPHEVERYMGVYEVRPLYVFPNDNTDIMNVDDKSYGNPILEENEVSEILDVYFKKYRESIHSIDLVSIVNIEKSIDLENGNRYLIETKVKLNKGSEVVHRLSEYVYRKNVESNNLCQPIGLNLKHDVFVHIVITVKNQGRWIRIFIENMERIYAQTLDERFGIILIDFESSDIDLEILLRQSKLKHWILLKMSGNFIKVQAQNAAMDVIKNPEEILFTCDLHLDIPSDIINVIRKHTFKGRSGYAPVLTRLQCGHTIQNPLGFWEVYGYGLFSFYKSDWMVISGMNTQDFSDSWGGEDWDLVDRVLSNGYEIERMKHRNLYHFYHSRHGMWNNS